MVKLFLTTVVSMVCATSAVAAPAWEFSHPGQIYSNGIWNFATAFAVNSDIVVSGLGFYADTAAGLTNPVPAALYECADSACQTSGTLLAQAMVDNRYAQLRNFRYASIAPITLKVGMSYEVAGISSNNNYTWSTLGYVADPAITRLQTSGSFARWQESGTLSFLTGSAVIQSEIMDGYMGPNLFFGSPDAFTGAPEPAAWMTMIVGFGAVGAARRRRLPVLRTSALG